MTDRRKLLQNLASVGACLTLGEQAFGAVSPAAEPGLTDATVSSAEWVSVRGKLPLIKRTFRPPNLETPLAYFRNPITPNNAFFVRYHHANIPVVDPGTWSLRIAGPAAERSVKFTLAQLRQQFEMVDVTALCLCSGNRRGLFSPHVVGVQWGSGAMGNARWRGVRLKDVLQKVGLRSDALEVAFDGADGPVMPSAPDFQKSLPVSRALDPDTLIAFEMNGERLPELHGAPARLIVPGWTATYWVKHLISIEIRNAPFDNFWMKTAYRLPLGKFPGMGTFVSQDTATSSPITQIAVNSLITAPTSLTALRRGSSARVQGLAWDSGAGLQRVEVSLDRGGSWSQAQLARDLGRYSLRAWTFTLTAPHHSGPLTVWAKATSRDGSTQPLAAVPNPSGYHHNQIQTLDLVVL